MAAFCHMDHDMIHEKNDRALEEGAKQNFEHFREENVIHLQCFELIFSTKIES